MPLVSSGVEHGNLRELALARMKDLGTQVRRLSVRIWEELLGDITQSSSAFEMRRHNRSQFYC